MRKWVPTTMLVFGIILVLVLVYAVVNQIREYHLQHDPILDMLTDIMKPVHPIFENLKIYKGSKSYTLNKERVFLCIYDENGDMYPLNMLIYVLLHEVAHMLNDKDVGHTKAFHAKFDELLDKATELQIYNPSIPIIADYCNHE